MFSACLKFQCLSIIKNNKTTCECANRHIPCDKNLQFDLKDNCENQTVLQKEYSSASLKTSESMNTLFLDEFYYYLFFVF